MSYAAGSSEDHLSLNNGEPSSSLSLRRSCLGLATEVDIITDAVRGNIKFHTSLISPIHISINRTSHMIPFHRTGKWEKWQQALSPDSHFLFHPWEEVFASRKANDDGNWAHHTPAKRPFQSTFAYFRCDCP